MESQRRSPRRGSRGGNAARARRQASEFYDEGPRIVPVLPIRNAVVLPYTVTPLYIDDEKTRRAVEAALMSDGLIFAVAQHEERQHNPAPHDLYLIGVEAIVERSFVTNDNGMSVMVRALRRARAHRYLDEVAYLRAEIEPLPEVAAEETAELVAQLRIVRQQFEQVAKNGGR